MRHTDWSWKFLDFIVGLFSVSNSSLTYAEVRLDCLKTLSEIEITIRWEYQDTTFISEGNMPRLICLMKNVSSSMPTAKFGTIPNQTKTPSAPKRTWRSILPPMCTVYWLAVRTMHIFQRWMQWFYLEQSSFLLARLSLALVSRRHRTVYMICGKTP